ncbi:MAG: substrate-binding domain-containing protein [Opitutaceae bacterium]
MKSTPDKVADPVRIDILANIQFAYGRNAIRGVRQYLQEKRPDVELDVLLHEPSYLNCLDSLYDGLLTTIHPPELDQIRSTTPVIQLTGHRSVEHAQVDNVDNLAVGALAAKSLVDFGVASCVYFEGFYNNSVTQHVNSRQREQGYLEELKALESDHLHRCCVPDHLSSRRELMDWIASLPKPLGVFAFNDLRALEVAECCKVLGLSIPHEVAIIGVDDDQFFTRMNRPHLSSIDTNITAVAHNATARLLAMIEGTTVAESDCISEQPVLHARASTGAYCCDDSVVSKAINTMMRQLHEKPRFAMIAREIGCTLRVLEQRFQTYLGSSMTSVFRELQIFEAKRLIRNSDDPLDEIAYQLGMELSGMCRLFKQVCRQTPGAYKKCFDRHAPQLPPAANHGFNSARKDIHIGLILPLTGQCSYEIIRGAQAYAERHGKLRLSLCIDATQPLLKKGFSDLEDFDAVSKCDAFIASHNVVFPPGVLGSKPVVTVDHERSMSDCWQLSANNYELGAIAAKYYLRKGFQQFAYCGLSASGFSIGASDSIDSRSEQRQQGFCDTLLNAGVAKSSIQCMVYCGFGSLVQPLIQLPAKTGIFAFNDVIGRLLIEQCRQLGIRVPEDISVLGCDNGEFLCEQSSPTLSSIDVNFFLGAFRAIEQLVNHFESGSGIDSSSMVAECRHVVERDSTASLGVNDPRVQNIVEYIQRHYAQNLSVEQIVENCQLTRRAAEVRFRKVIPHGILDEVHTVRLNHARDLLTASPLSIKEIADRVGYINAAHFARTFKKYMGLSPKVFRQQHSNLVLA